MTQHGSGLAHRLLQRRPRRPLRRVSRRTLPFRAPASYSCHVDDTLERRLIPTKYRSLISKELSYPVGAEIVSAALTGVPQFDVLRLSFYNDATPANLRRHIARGAEVQVFRANYRNYRGTEEWDLSVYP